MSDQLHLKIKGVIIALLLVLAFGASTVSFDSCSAEQDGWTVESNERLVYLALASDYLAAGPSQTYAARAEFAPRFEMVGVLPAGSLGLPGEPITWVITVTNASDSAGNDLIITDKLPPDLRVDSATAARGEVSVSEQMVIFTLPALAVGDEATFFIYTTVQNASANGVIRNQAALVAAGPNGPVSQVALAEVSVPTGLPPTGYAPGEEAPAFDIDRPSLGVMVALAVSLVGLTAVVVYYRGRRV